MGHREPRRRRAVLMLALAGTTTASVWAQSTAPAGARPPVRGGYTEAATLPVRILEFAADRTAVDPGTAVTLRWAVENPRSVQGSDPLTISPGIGRVVPVGQRSVTPTATTTYRLTATGINGPVTRTITVTVAGTEPVATPDEPAVLTSQPAPRTADGKPDLTGVYGSNVAPGGPPPAGSLPRTPTLKPGAEKYRVVRDATDAGLYSTCRPPGVPQTFMVPYYLQIVQAPRYVVILHEYLSLPRIIPLDATHPPDPDPFYMGHSVGRWDGDTLVVDSIGFKESEVGGYQTTEALHTVERFRRPNLGTLEYEVVIDDRNVFAGPWLITRTFPYLPERNRVDEFVCENNRDYKPLFGNK